MACFNITSGSVPAQNRITFDFNQFTIRTMEGGLRTYALKAAIKSLNVLSETDQKVIFKLTLKDNVSFTAEANPVAFQKVKEAELKSANEGDKFILKDKTPK